MLSVPQTQSLADGDLFGRRRWGRDKFVVARAPWSAERTAVTRRWAWIPSALVRGRGGRVVLERDEQIRDNFWPRWWRGAFRHLYAANREYRKVENEQRNLPAVEKQKNNKLRSTRQSLHIYRVAPVSCCSQWVCFKVCVFFCWGGLAWLTTVINDPASRAMCHVVSPPAAVLYKYEPHH